jgi:hypothetical protein
MKRAPDLSVADQPDLHAFLQFLWLALRTFVY